MEYVHAAVVCGQHLTTTQPGWQRATAASTSTRPGAGGGGTGTRASACSPWRSSRPSGPGCQRPRGGRTGRPAGPAERAQCAEAAAQSGLVSAPGGRPGARVVSLASATRAPREGMPLPKTEGQAARLLTTAVGLRSGRIWFAVDGTLSWTQDEGLT